ncbi:Os01g0661601, partial [Oryza sativa Japonica Group]
MNASAANGGTGKEKPPPSSSTSSSPSTAATAAAAGPGASSSAPPRWSRSLSSMANDVSRSSPRLAYSGWGLLLGFIRGFLRIFAWL